MSNGSQEQAISLLEEAKEKGALDPAIESRLVRLVGAETRPKMEEALETPIAAEPENVRELSPEQHTRVLSALETRFAKQPEHYKRPEGVNFDEVRKALEANSALMHSLAQMEWTGGVPDVIAIDDDVFVFGDCSAESPDRRNLTYDEAAEMAKKFGVDMMPEEVYCAMQKSGKFDMETWSWLATPADVRESGAALHGFRDVDGVGVDEALPGGHRPYWGWRGVLRVPKVK